MDGERARPDPQGIRSARRARPQRRPGRQSRGPDVAGLGRQLVRLDEDARRSRRRPAPQARRRSRRTRASSRRCAASAFASPPRPSRAKEHVTLRRDPAAGGRLRAAAGGGRVRRAAGDQPARPGRRRGARAGAQPGRPARGKRPPSCWARARPRDARPPRHDVGRIGARAGDRRRPAGRVIADSAGRRRARGRLLERGPRSPPPCGGDERPADAPQRHARRRTSWRPRCRSCGAAHDRGGAHHAERRRGRRRGAAVGASGSSCWRRRARARDHRRRPDRAANLPADPPTRRSRGRCRGRRSGGAGARSRGRAEQRSLAASFNEMTGPGRPAARQPAGSSSPTPPISSGRR